MGFAAEVGEQTYMANQITKAATAPPLHAAIQDFHDGSATPLMRMNDYFRTHGFVCPVDSMDYGFQWAFDTKLSYFGWTHEDPEMTKSFNTLMKGMHSTRSHRLDWFPAESELLSDFSGKENDVLLVDVGGGRGHDVERFLSRYPQSKGHLVLQDLPAAISSIQELSQGIERSAHDVFTPQPVHGARAYYAHHVFHDWPDDACQKILCNLMPAMKPGYSKILINDSVLPDRDYPSFAAAGDLNMMVILGGMERTRNQWIRLVESVGLQVVRVWESPYGSDVDGIVEAMLKTGREEVGKMGT